MTSDQILNLLDSKSHIGKPEENLFQSKYIQKTITKKNENTSRKKRNSYCLWIK